MANDYYNAGSWPATGAAGASAPARAELTSITAGFAKLPTLTANGSKAVIVNSGATALTVTTGTLALAGNFATTGAYNTTLVQQASTTVTLPTTNSVMARTDAAQTFTGVQTLSSQPILSSLTASLPVFSDGSKGLVSNAMTGTGNVVMSASPTLTGTITAAIANFSGLVTASAGVSLGGSTLSVYTTWANYTPTVTLVGGGGNTVPVYTTNSGRWLRVGNIVFVRVYLAGDGGDEGAGSGAINVALPVAVGASAQGNYFDVGSLFNGANQYILVGTLPAAATTLKLNYKNAIDTQTDATGALQNNATREITLNFCYEV